MRNSFVLQTAENVAKLDDRSEHSSANLSGAVFPFQAPMGRVEPVYQHSRRQLVSTKELSEIWGVAESTLRYWRCAEIGPIYVKLGGRIKYDLADVDRYVRANKRMPSVRAHGG
jgi:hypothetical protein